MSSNETLVTPTLQFLQHLASVSFSLNRYFTCRSPWLTTANCALLNWPLKGTRMPSGCFWSRSQKPQGREDAHFTDWGKGGGAESCEWFYNLEFRGGWVFSQESREGSNVAMTVELKLACFPVYCLYFCQEF